MVFSAIRLISGWYQFSYTIFLIYGQTPDIWSIFMGNLCPIDCKDDTGLFTASGHFEKPLISVVDGPILKPFGVVIVITGWFGLVYNNA